MNAKLDMLLWRLGALMFGWKFHTASLNAQDGVLEAFEFLVWRGRVEVKAFSFGDPDIKRLCGHVAEEGQQ